MRKLWFVFSLILFCVAVPSALAQESVSLEYGQVIGGEINGDSPTVEFTFAGSKADTIYASVFDNDFSVVLRLTGPNGVLMEQSEDNLLTDSLIGPTTLPDDGTYTIMATRPEWEDMEGSFKLRVDTAEVIAVESHASLDGDLGEGEVRFITYNGSAGDVLSYTLDGTEIGIRVLAPGGAMFINDGFYDNPYRFFNFVPENGPYFGAIQTIAEDGTAFTFNLGPVEVVPIAPGAPVSGSVVSGQSLAFTFDSAADKLWHLSAAFTNTADGQSELEIHKPDDEYYYGGSLAWDCCSGSNGTPRIDPFTAPTDGTYYVLLNYDSWNPDVQTVDYELTLAPSTLVSLAPGTTISQTITQASGNAIFAYNGAEGEVVRVTLQKLSGAGYPGMVVRSLEEEVLIFYGYRMRAATFEIEITVAGMYLVEVDNLNYDDSEIEFSLLLERLEQ